MERYIRISMEYSHSAAGFLRQLRDVVDWSKRQYALEEYKLARMGLKRIGKNVQCTIVFAPK